MDDGEIGDADPVPDEEAEPDTGEIVKSVGDTLLDI